MNERVLVVDDQPMIREVVRSMLETRGYDVITAKDGDEALRLFADAHPAIALIDVDMPGPNGVEVCGALRSAAATLGRVLPVWLMTGVERPGLEYRAERAGALGVLPKPFTCDQLVIRLGQALSNSGPASSAA
jgi:CheY-like chemotaxis protein